MVGATLAVARLCPIRATARVAPTSIKILHSPASVGTESRPEYSTSQ